MNSNINTNDDYYIDDEYNEEVEFNVEKEKKNFNPKIFLIPIGILVVLILIVFVVRNISNNVPLILSDLYIEDSNLTPNFKPNIYNYEAKTDKNEVYIACKVKNKKVKTKGCNDYVALKNGNNNHKIEVGYKGKKKVYNLKLIKESKIEVEVVGNPTEWTNKDVILTVNAKAEKGLAEEPYSFDGGETWQKDNTKTFDRNTETKIVVKDIEENVSIEEIVNIDKIDKTVPTINITKDETMLTAIITPESCESGYEYQWYKNGVEINDENSLIHKTTGDGSYKLVVTTGAGTIAEETYTIATTYTVKFDSNGGSKVNEQTVIAGQTVKKPNNPTRNGYTFNGWLLNGNSYNFASKVNKNITLTASWKKKQTNNNTGNKGNNSSNNTNKDSSKVSGITLSQTSIVMKPGAKTTLYATVTPATASNKQVIWSSSNNSVAVVDSTTGVVRAKSKGTVTIKATTIDGNKTAVCTITVN